jgi:hypothetical protein
VHLILATTISGRLGTSSLSGRLRQTPDLGSCTSGRVCLFHEWPLVSPWVGRFWHACGTAARGLFVSKPISDTDRQGLGSPGLGRIVEVDLLELAPVGHGNG